MSPGTVLSARPKSDYGPRSALRRKCRIPGFSRTIFRLGVANLSPSTPTPSSRIEGQSQGACDEKANGDRIFCHFIDGRGVLRRRLAADGTAALSIGPSHGRRMDGHLFWSQCRLRLGTGLIKYRFWRWSGKYRFANSGRRDDAIWTRCDRARRYEPAGLKQSARRHCWRSSGFQLASRNGRLRSRV
jgi:hypothetical protein